MRYGSLLSQTQVCAGAPAANVQICAQFPRKRRPRRMTQSSHFRARKKLLDSRSKLRALEGERKRFVILRSAAIEVTEIELNRDEADILRLYRGATRERKATIQAKAAEMAKMQG